MVAHRDDALARRDVPDGHEARVAAAPAAGEKEFAVSTEFEIAQRALGKRQHAEKFKISRVVEHDLARTGEGDDGSPRAAGDRAERCAVRGADKGFEGKRAGHRRRALGFADRGALEGEIDGRFVGCEGFAVHPLQQTACDPLADGADLFVGEFRLRRHGRIFGVGDGLEKLAAVGISGVEGGATAAAFDRAAE